MLQRGSTEAAQRLRRAKSNPSGPWRATQRTIPAFNPDIAQQTALTAATIAFERATETTETQGHLGSARVGRSQSERKSQRSVVGFQVARPTSKGSNKGRRSPGRTVQNFSHVKKAKSSCQLTPVSNRTSIGSNVQAPHCTDSSAHWETDQFADRFDGYGLQPSTRLRKSQSSYVVPQLRPQIDFTPASECSTRSFRTSPKRVVRPKSSVREHQTDEAIIALARDRYLQELQPLPKPLKPRRSSISASLRSRFRKAARSSWQMNDCQSQEQPHIEVSDAQLLNDPTTLPSSKPHKHKISFTSIKNGWRRAFSRPSNTISALPPQHIESTQMHYGTRAVTPSEVYPGDSYSCGVSTDDWAFDRPPTPPPHRQDVHEMSSLNKHGFDSLKPYDIAREDRSRVTSWNDSTRQSTLMFHDLKQLPSIQERIDMQDILPSPSPEKDLKIPTRRSSSYFNRKEALDGRRLISALMKHTKLKSEKESDKQGFFAQSELAAESTELEEQGPRFSRQSVTGQAPHMQIPILRLPELERRQADPVPFSRSNVISPSVYSERYETLAQTADNSSSPHRSSSPTGIATVVSSHAIGRWHVGERNINERHTTSNEWRTWAANKSAGIDSAREFVLPTFDSQIQQTLRMGNRDASQALKGLPDVGTRKTSGATRERQDSISKQVSLMNDRFPMLGTGRTASKSSLASSRRISHSRAQSLLDRDKECSILRRQETKNRFEITATTCSNNDDKAVINRAETAHSSKASLHDFDEATDASSGDKEANDQNRNARFTVTPPAARAERADRGSPLAARGLNALDENLLVRIRKGPYGVSSASPIRADTGSIDSICLPKRQSPARSARSNENTPPSKGQRMVNEFLRSRASNLLDSGNSSSPAFL